MRSNLTQHRVPEGLVSSAAPSPLWSGSVPTYPIYVTNLPSANYQTLRCYFKLADSFQVKLLSLILTVGPSVCLPVCSHVTAPIPQNTPKELYIYKRF